ncbi:MAG: rRNA methyltransferase [Firmicutes bacterium]|nr:rRNA methyltransferase [Bacillota bacterium]
MHIPLSLEAALESELSSVSSKDLAKVVTDLSERYRAKGSSKRGKLLQSSQDITAYAAFRLPATYAAVYAALEQVREGQPGWQPQTLMDVGAGPGTVMWAAAAVWPSLQQVSSLERESAMIALGKRLAEHSEHSALKQANWRQVDLTTEWDAASADLVTASYVLNELTQADRRSLVNKLWSLTETVLVVIEPGTPEGFAAIREVREQLAGEGARIAAPCPHSGACPMTEPDWCHFSQRIARSQLHRRVKSGTLSYEDEKFSFVAASKIPGEEIPGRILRHPQIRKGHIRLVSCTPEGLKEEVVSRRDRALFRQARNLQWGSIWPPVEDL